MGGGGLAWEDVCGTGGEIHGRVWKVEDVGCVVCVMQSRSTHDTRAYQGHTLRVGHARVMQCMLWDKSDSNVLTAYIYNLRYKAYGSQASENASTFLSVSQRVSESVTVSRFI